MCNHIGIKFLIFLLPVHIFVFHRLALQPFFFLWPQAAQSPSPHPFGLQHEFWSGWPWLCPRRGVVLFDLCSFGSVGRRGCALRLLSTVRGPAVRTDLLSAAPFWFSPPLQALSLSCSLLYLCYQARSSDSVDVIWPPQGQSPRCICFALLPFYFIIRSSCFNAGGVLEAFNSHFRKFELV